MSGLLHYADAQLRAILEGARVIAVVGASPRPERASHEVMTFLQSRGYRCIPVNPAASEILGRKCYPDVKSLPEKPDIVNVFRAPEHVPPIADETVGVKAECLWLQSGIVHDEATRKASDAGLYVIQDRCIRTLHTILVR